MVIKVVMGRCYLDGLIGDAGAQEKNMEKKVRVWDEALHTLVGVPCQHPQASYVGLKNSIQH